MIKKSELNLIRKFDREDWITSLPGLMLSLAPAIMAVLDLISPGMSEAQYEVYPILIRVVVCVAVICMIAWLIICRGAVQLKDSVCGAGRTHKTAFVCWALFVMCIIISTAVNSPDQTALLGGGNRHVGAVDIVIYITAFMALDAGIRREVTRQAVIRCFIISADFVAVTALISTFVHPVLAYLGKQGFSTVFFHANHYGYYLTMAACVSAGHYLYGDRRDALFGGISMALNLGMLAINQTMGCILATGFVILTAAIYVIVKVPEHRRRAAILIAALILSVPAAALVSPSVRYELELLVFDIGSIANGGDGGKAGHRRWLLWGYTIDYIRQRPILGYGCEGITDMLYDATGTANPHCEILTLAAFFGIPAAILYTAGSILMIVHGLRSNSGNNEAAGLSAMAAGGYLLSSLFGVGMFYTLPFFFMFMGLAAARDDRENNI